MMAWVDVETTGLDITRDALLEVGLIITDDDFHELARWSAPIWTLDEALWRGRENEIVNAMHAANGLFRDCRGPKAVQLFEAEEALIALMGRDDFEVQPPMCGSSVHFDRAILQIWMPKFEEMFHYRNIDVSTLKELAARWWPKMILSRPPDRKMHRVIPDIEDSIAELRHYRDRIDDALER
jgi:oligoribonuclease